MWKRLDSNACTDIYKWNSNIFFQKAVIKHIEKKARLQRNRYKMLEEFHLRLTDFYSSCKKFTNSLYEKFGNDVGCSFNEEIQTFKKLRIFYLVHKKAMPAFATAIDQINQRMENVHDGLIHIQNDHNGIISSETIIPVAEHYNKMIEILEQTINDCCQELNSIYS